MSDKKYNDLLEYIRSCGRAAVAFSGGVDSAFLLYAAKEALGENVIALTAVSEFFPERETKEAKEFCEKYGIRQIVFGIGALEIPGVADNPPDRCYLCKKALFSKMKVIAAQNGADVLMDGSNKDDEGDYRPGLIALKELEICSPLREKQFTKADIRGLSRMLGLPTWDKQSFACLASRFPYGDTITKEKLEMVDRAEQCLLDLGFGQIRVRIHGNLARIEADRSQMKRFLDENMRDLIVEKIKEAGFSYVSLDLAGYRTGSMNEIL